MRIIHTADWHLGHVLYGHDRSADHRIALACLAKYVAEYQPDALVVSGDIFHTSQPSAAAMQLLAEALVDMRNQAPGMHIVLTAGNHDSPTRHEVFKLPWQVLGVTVVGRPPIHDNDFERFILPISDKGYVIALPYMHPRFVPDGFYERIYAEVEALNTTKLPVIAMSHAAIIGCDITGHENHNIDVIGSLDTISIDNFGVGYDYMALGHIHHNQTLKRGSGAVRYAGSLIPVSFTENYTHSVTLVEINKHGDKPHIKELPLNTGRRLVTLGTAEGYTPEQIAKELFNTLEGMQEGDFLRVNVCLDSTKPLPSGLTQLVSNACEEVGVNLCGFNILRKSIAGAAVAASLSSEELQSIAPLELLRIYAAQNQKELDDEMVALFTKIANKEIDDHEN